MAFYPYMYLLVVVGALASPKEGYTSDPGASSLVTSPDQQWATTPDTSSHLHPSFVPALHSSESMQGPTNENRNSTTHDLEAALCASAQMEREGHDPGEVHDGRRVQNSPASPLARPRTITSRIRARLSRARCQLQGGWSQRWLSCNDSGSSNKDGSPCGSRSYYGLYTEGILLKYEVWCRAYLRQLRSEFGKHRQYHLYTEPLTEQEQAWASQVEMAAFQDFLAAGHATVASNTQRIDFLPTDSQVLSQRVSTPDPDLPYGVFHAAWVNSRTGRWGPRGTEDPETTSAGGADAANHEEEEDFAMFQTRTAPRPSWEQLMEQLGDWFQVGRQVGMAVSMVRSMVHSS